MQDDPNFHKRLQNEPNYMHKLVDDKQDFKNTLLTYNVAENR